MEQMQLFQEVGAFPYPEPCSWRERCGAYHAEGGGCDGSRGWCLTGQLASGRLLPDSTRRLMSPYQIRWYERRGLL